MQPTSRWCSLFALCAGLMGACGSDDSNDTQPAWPKVTGCSEYETADCVVPSWSCWRGGVHRVQHLDGLQERQHETVPMWQLSHRV